jgi:hypothetical protein
VAEPVAVTGHHFYQRFHTAYPGFLLVEWGKGLSNRIYIQPGDSIDLKLIQTKSGDDSLVIAGSDAVANSLLAGGHVGIGSFESIVPDIDALLRHAVLSDSAFSIIREYIASRECALNILSRYGLVSPGFVNGISADIESTVEYATCNFLMATRSGKIGPVSALSDTVCNRLLRLLMMRYDPYNKRFIHSQYASQNALLKGRLMIENVLPMALPSDTLIYGPPPYISLMKYQISNEPVHSAFWSHLDSTDQLIYGLAPGVIQQMLCANEITSAEYYDDIDPGEIRRMITTYESEYPLSEYIPLFRETLFRNFPH